MIVIMRTLALVTLVGRLTMIRRLRCRVLGADDESGGCCDGDVDDDDNDDYCCYYYYGGGNKGGGDGDGCDATAIAPKLRRWILMVHF